MAFPHAYGLACLELAFLLIAIMLLHNLKSLIGPASFYLALGTIVVFGQFISAAGFRIIGAQPGADVSLGPVIFFTPLLAALLVIYIVDGTLEAQRMTVGIMVVAGVFLYLAHLSEKQCDISGYRLDPALPIPVVQTLMHGGRRFMLASLLSLLIQFLTLPIIYQLLRNRDLKIATAVCSALFLSQVIDVFFYELVTNFHAENWWVAVTDSYFSRVASTVLASFSIVIYLKQVRLAEGMQTDQRGALDMLSALLGQRAKSQRLQAHIREWEGRYRMVVENTNDLIFLVDQRGVILDANSRATRHAGRSVDDAPQWTIDSLMRLNTDDAQFDWTQLWQRVFPSGTESATGLGEQEWLMTTADGGTIVLDVNISPLQLPSGAAVLLAARDISRRHDLERERAQLQDKFVSFERMDAVGKLAGGIAHDFNNLLHAIQGSLDMLERTRDEEESRRLIANISLATERADMLTRQLLAFGRGGKYDVVPIRIDELVRQTEALFRPLLGKCAQLKVAIHPDPMIVEGDSTQLQEVLLNLLLNAHEALEDGSGTIVLRVEPASAVTPGWDESTEERDDNQSYIVLRVRDDGQGMDAETQSRIFEPFFTTKEETGTGMGLAMTYGCVENHHGWVHIQSELGRGTEFFIFLPRKPH